MHDFNEASNITRLDNQQYEPFSRSALWYGIVFAATQVAVLVVCVLIAAHPWFLEHDGYPIMRYNLGYSLRLKHADCQILLYGDSAPLTGLDPAYIQARTGLKTCNISEFRSIHWLMSSYFPIDQYLAHNSRPRFIFSDWNAFEFHPEPTTADAYQGEGFEYALLYSPRAHFWNVLFRHPIWPVKFGIWVENRLIDDAWSRWKGTHDATWAKEREPRDSRAGLWRDSAPPETECMSPAAAAAMLRNHRMGRDEAQSAIREFKQRYSSQGIHVIVDVSPVAACVANRSDLIAATDGLSDNPLLFLPVRYYNTQDVHFVPEGSHYVSRLAADQILAIMRQDDAAKRTVTPSVAAGVQNQ